MQGDRSYFCDQLVDRGWPVKRVVKISYVPAACSAVLGCVSITLRTRYIILFSALVFAAVVALVVRFKRVRLESPQPAEREPDCSPQ
jgi:hypothetical protein